MIVAHRGASQDAPENTLAAFRLAWQQGADGIEGDFYLTLDHEIVCIHDADTGRTTGTKRIVEASTLEELRQLEYGSWKHARFQGEPIATIEQVLETVPDGKTLVIELKSTQAIVPVLAEKLTRIDRQRVQLLLIGFDKPTIKLCKQLMPMVKTHWLTGFDKQSANGPYQPTASQIAATVDALGADGVGMKGDLEVIDAAFIEELRANGCQEFHVWTVDSIEDAKVFQSLGVVGITTNLPGKIQAAISK